MKVDLSQWHPVASSSDLPLRHVYQGQLWGHELAIWRADDGHVNVWENRCLHRGVRLSIGLNEGSELRCLYHGWRYANRTAGCTYIPAHPADAPARTVCNNTYQCIEKYGLVWSAVAPERSFETPVTLTDTAPLTLRAIPINAPSDLVQKFATDYPYGMVTHKSDTSMTLQSGASELQLFFQPVDSGKTIIRGLLVPQPVNPIVALRHHNAMMTALRDKIELAVSGLAPPRAIEVEFKPVAKDLAQMPNINTAGPKVEFRAKVAKKWITSQNVMAFRLEAFSEQFPTFQPGAHIDVSLPNGMLRQYSLTNGPGQTDHQRGQIGLFVLILGHASLPNRTDQLVDDGGSAEDEADTDDDGAGGEPGQAAGERQETETDHGDDRQSTTERASDELNNHFHGSLQWAEGPAAACLRHRHIGSEELR